MIAYETVLELAAASKQYYQEYGTSPPPDQIIPALMGANPRKIVFYQGETDPAKVIDPWGTPYHFDLSDPREPRVWSSGRDRRDDGGAKGSDDVVSWH